MSALCPNCSTGDESVEFESVRDLVAHMKSGHMTRPEKKLRPNPKPVTLSTTELRALEETKQNTPQVTTTSVASPASAALVVKPLELQYRWIGVHAACNSEPKTIEVDLADTTIVVAFCMNCNEKLMQREVPKLTKQKIKEPDDTLEKVFKGKKK